MVKVYMGIPSTGERSDAQTYALRTIEEKYKDEVQLVYPKDCVYRMFHDFARNCIVEDFLKSDCDILWFLDSDVIPPDNVLDIVTKRGDWKLAGAPYPVFMTPAGMPCPQVVFTVYLKDATGFHAAPIPVQPREPMLVDGMATGCLFIKREVLEKVQKPYFEFKYRDADKYITEGEDLGFCRKASDLGYKFLCDFSLVCRHIKKVDLLDVNNYAMLLVQNALMAQDRRIREALAAKKLAQMADKEKKSVIEVPSKQIIRVP